MTTKTTKAPLEAYGFRLDQGTLARIDAVRGGVSRSETVRRALALGLERIESNPAKELLRPR